MKKKILFATVIVALASVTTIVSNAKKSEAQKSAIVSESVEALSESEAQNTGPADKERCVDHHGHRMVCRSMNPYPCTGTECF